MKNKAKTIENKQDVLFDLAKKSFEETMFKVIEKKIKAEDDTEQKVENESVLSVIVGFSGGVNGRILLNTSIEYGKNIAAVLNGSLLEKEEKLHSHLVEFANLFCQKFIIYIDKTFGKREIWVTPPAVFSAKVLDLITPNVLSRNIFYDCSQGKFIMNIGFSDGEYDGI